MPDIRYLILDEVISSTNNFLNYLVYNPHYNNSDPGHIDNL